MRRAVLLENVAAGKQPKRGYNQGSQGAEKGTTRLASVAERALEFLNGGTMEKFCGPASAISKPISPRSCVLLKLPDGALLHVQQEARQIRPEKVQRLSAGSEKCSSVRHKPLSRPGTPASWKIR